MLSYWRLSGVSLDDRDQLGVVLDALADGTRKRGVVEAWGLVRKWEGGEEERAGLVKRVLARCFGGECEPPQCFLAADAGLAAQC